MMSGRELWSVLLSLASLYWRAVDQCGTGRVWHV